MATSKGVLQGYTGVAAVDSAHQIIVEAQAHGTGAEQELLGPAVTATDALRTADTLITADAGYHSGANLEALAAMRVAALIADNEMRRRDERFATQDRYTALPNPLHNKATPTPALSPCFTPSDFVYDADARTCTCPAGKSLYRKGRANMTKDYVGEHFRGAKRDCVPCALRAGVRCMLLSIRLIRRSQRCAAGRPAARKQTRDYARAVAVQMCKAHHGDCERRDCTRAYRRLGCPSPSRKSRIERHTAKLHTTPHQRTLSPRMDARRSTSRRCGGRRTR